MKDLIMYIILGFIQGLTEPIPVSSSGHVLIIQTILQKFITDIPVDFGTLATITNLGSLVAIIVLFREKIFTLVKSFITYIFKKEERKKLQNDYNHCWKIVLATIPAGLMGLVATVFDLLDTLEENVKFIGLTLLITSVFLYLIKDFKGKKDEEDISWKDAFIIGLYQMVAIIPGISRSGSTIVGGMFQGLKRETAFNFSFILYIPISIATSILGIKDLFELGLASSTWILYIIAAIVSGIFTYICTKWFAKIVKEGKLIYFSIYCLIVGTLVILFL
mgnify:CR=1 FL=1